MVVDVEDITTLIVVTAGAGTRAETPYTYTCATRKGSTADNGPGRPRTPGAAFRTYIHAIDIVN